MQSNGTISFDVMLTMFAQGRTTPFRIGYVVSQGKRKGEVREMLLYPGVPNPTPRPVSQRKSTPKAATTYKNRAMLPFTEFNTNQYRELFSYNIITVDGKTVIS